MSSPNRDQAARPVMSSAIGFDRNSVIVAFLGIITVVLVGAALKATQSVVLPLIIAWLLSYILGPIVTFLSRRRVPAALSITFVLVLMLTLGYFTAVFLQARIVNFVAQFDAYNTRLMELIHALTERWDGSDEWFRGIDWGSRITEFLVKLTGPLASFLSKLVLVVAFLVFLLLGKPYFPAKVHQAFSEERADQITKILGSISSQIGHYLVMQLLISLATGISVYIALILLGVDFPVTWGAMAFFLNFIPVLGSIAASIPPVLLALVQFDTPWRAVGVGIALFGIQMFIGNGVAPKVHGDRLNLSPVVVLLSLVFWGWLWGITGALLAVPIASSIKIVCENIHGLKPIGTMMGSGKAAARAMG